MEKNNISEVLKYVQKMTTFGFLSRGKYNNKPILTILQLHPTTVRRILKRMLKCEPWFGCSRCGWREGCGDLHHINGKTGHDCDFHNNLSYLCPNCHRMYHEGTITAADIVTFEVQIGDKWKEYYFG